MTINNFKNFMENLWGNIPTTTRKPSDGWTKASQLSMSSNSKDSSGAPMQSGGAPGSTPLMMDKDEIKPKKKKYDQKN
jgi:hypothetical protein